MPNAMKPGQRLTVRGQRSRAGARHYDEPALAALIIQIGLINVWNRLNATVRQVAGEWKP
jgi:alkylhydroperoxidase family enzyme